MTRRRCRFDPREGLPPRPVAATNLDAAVLAIGVGAGVVDGPGANRPLVLAFHQPRECIALPGSSRANHRQDQALLAVLAYRAGRAHPGRKRTRLLL